MYEYSAWIRFDYNGSESAYPCFGRTWKGALAGLLRRIGKKGHTVIQVVDYQENRRIRFENGKPVIEKNKK